MSIPSGVAPVVPLFAHSESRTRVLLVDDHELLGQILVHALNAAGLAAQLASAPTVAAVAECLATARPEVALLDLDLGEAHGTGLQLIPTLIDAGTQVIMLTGSRDRLALAECLEAGAIAVVGKDEPLDVLIGAISDAVAGKPMRADARHDLLQELWAARARAEEAGKPFGRLTRREQEVLGALTEGLSAAEIADRDYVSLATVRSQIRGVLVKLGVTSQLAAVAMASRSGWQPPGV